MDTQVLRRIRSQLVLSQHLLAIDPHISNSCFRVFGNNHSKGPDVSASVQMVPFGHGKFFNINPVSCINVFLTGPFFDYVWRDRISDGLQDFTHSRSDIRLGPDSQAVFLMAKESARKNRETVIFHPLEEARRTVDFENPSHDGTQLQV